MLHLPLGEASDTDAVIVNITSADPSTNLGYVTAWPSGEARPTASTINLQPGYNVSNLALLKVGADGAIDLYTNVGSTHLIVDLMGDFRPIAATERFLPLAPTRVYDSRNGAVFEKAQTRQVKITGVDGVPASARVMVMNATATQATSANGFLTIWGILLAKPYPLTSNLNYRPPWNASNQVITNVPSPEGVNMYNDLAKVHIVLDATGYFVLSP